MLNRKEDSHYIITFDIETIPDDEAANNLIHNLDKNASLEQKREALTNYHLEITEGKNPFLRQPFWKIVALSCCVARKITDNEEDNYYQIVDVSSFDYEKSKKEAYIVESFFSLLNYYNSKALYPTTLVSFNGRTFDIPVLKYRAMKYGIATQDWYSYGDKWNNYSGRYNLDYHCDLLEALSDFGSSARIKLNEICSILGLPGKFGVEGSQVTQMYDEGRLDDIRDYCETDVINTYLVYLRYLLLTNKISKRGYNTSIETTLLYLQKDTGKKHFLNFYNAWEKSCEGKFNL